LTQAELALRVGVTQGYIARLETAMSPNYEINTLRKMAAALHKVLVIGFAEEAKATRRHIVQRRSVPELLVC
jgi:transcriptional regulator with XRE-family HTH domain